MHRIRRMTTAAGLTLVALALGATAAWGHASMQQSQVPAGAEVSMSMRVPVEQPGAANERIEMQVQAQWQILGCSGGLSFACDISEPDGDGRVVVVWERVTPNPAGTAEILFDFRARTPSRDEQGVYLFPTIQTYDNGDESAWIQRDADGDRPAPRVQVGDSSSEVRDDPEPTEPHGPSESSDDPTTEPTADGSGGTDAPGDASEEPTAETSPTQPVTTATPDGPTTDAEATEASTPEDVAGEADRGGDGGGNGGLFAIAGVLLALAAVGAAVYRWKFAGNA